MKYYSDYNKKYIQDICNFLNNKGYVIDEMNKIVHQSNLQNYSDRGVLCGEASALKPECFEDFTEFLQGTVVQQASIYQLLNENGLVNRGYCPYTGETIGKHAASWEYFGRVVYVSEKGLLIMRNEANKLFENLTGTPTPQKSEIKQGGCLSSIILLVGISMMWYFLF